VVVEAADFCINTSADRLLRNQVMSTDGLEVFSTVFTPDLLISKISIFQRDKQLLPDRLNCSLSKSTDPIKKVCNTKRKSVTLCGGKGRWIA